MNLNYVKKGDGPALVLIHGFLEDHHLWDQITPEGFTTYNFDLPGHGDSPIEPYELLDEIATEIMRVMILDEVSRYDVVGHSMGGYVALILKDKDQKCEKVILMNSTFKADSEQKKEDRKRVAELVMERKEFFLQQAIPGLFSNPQIYQNAVNELVNKALLMQPEALAYGSLAMSRRKDFTTLFSRFPEEILVVQGLSDPLIPAESMRIEKEKHNFPYYELPASHMAWVEIPNDCRLLLSQLLTTNSI